MALRHLDSSLRHARGGSREGSRQFRELRQQVAQQSPLSGEGKADETFANVIDSFEKKLEAAKAKGDTTLVAQLNSRIQTEFGIDPEHIDPNVTKGFKKLFEEQKKQLGAWYQKATEDAKKLRVAINDLNNLIGFDDQTDELETLLPGDSVAIQGRLEVESKAGRLTGLFVVALQVMALRKRSINRLPIGSTPRMAAL